jgi:hypothetical protein
MPSSFPVDPRCHVAGHELKARKRLGHSVSQQFEARARLS